MQYEESRVIIQKGATGELTPEEMEAEAVTELPEREAMTLIDPNFGVAPIEPPGADNIPLYHTQQE